MLGSSGGKGKERDFNLSPIHEDEDLDEIASRYVFAFENIIQYQHLLHIRKLVGLSDLHDVFFVREMASLLLT